MLAVPVDLGVDVLHPTTTVRRGVAVLRGVNLPPQYGGIGPGRNARASAPIPDVSPSYVAEQEAFRAHDVGIHESGGSFASLTNPAVITAHANLAHQSDNPAISLLFGTLAVAGSIARGGTVATGGGTAPGSGGARGNIPAPGTPAPILAGTGQIQRLIGSHGEEVLVANSSPTSPFTVAIGGGAVQTFPSGASTSAVLAQTGFLPPGAKRTVPLTEDEVQGSVLGFGKLGLPAATSAGTAIQPPVGPVLDPAHERPPPELPVSAPDGPNSTIDFMQKQKSQLAGKTKAKDP